jgi:hypothetical protein
MVTAAQTDAVKGLDNQLRHMQTSHGEIVAGFSALLGITLSRMIVVLLHDKSFDFTPSAPFEVRFASLKKILDPGLRLELKNALEYLKSKEDQEEVFIRQQGQAKADEVAACKREAESAGGANPVQKARASTARRKANASAKLLAQSPIQTTEEAQDEIIFAQYRLESLLRSMQLQVQGSLHLECA